MSAASLKVRAAIADICTQLTPRRRVVKLPPIPKWNKVTDDIDSADFARRSQDYERSLLPPELVFPRAGQVWQTVRECEIYVFRCMSAQQGPGAALGARIRLREGERVRILPLDHPKPLQVRFEPIRSPERHESSGPYDVRYELWMRIARTLPPSAEAGYFNELFRLVEDVT